MQIFPPEFSQAVRLPRREEPSLRLSGDRLRWFPLVVKSVIRGAALPALEAQLAPHLRRVRRPVPASSITDMTRNYSEALPKSTHNSTVFLDNPRTAAARAASAMGLTAFLRSRSLREFAEHVSGFALEPSPGLQAIRYAAGDYVGPHNDHHPEQPHLRNGYVDLQITLSHDAVARQYLLYERDGYFNQMVNIGIPSGVSVSRLPFWHQVTPLEARRGGEAAACRWLLLVSFVCKEENLPL